MYQSLAANLNVSITFRMQGVTEIAFSMKTVHSRNKLAINIRAICLSTGAFVLGLQKDVRPGISLMQSVNLVNRNNSSNSASKATNRVKDSKTTMFVTWRRKNTIMNDCKNIGTARIST